MLKRMIILISALSIVVIAVAFVILNVEIFNRLTIIDSQCARRVGEEDFTPDNFALEDYDTSSYLMSTYETVTFPSRDGLRISGFFIPSPISPVAQSETVIIVHGYNDCKRRPFSLLPAGMLHRNNMNALVIDLRNHGDSEVNVGRMSAGVHEAQDVLGAWDWLISDKGIPPEKIGVFGYSMGGATILIAMAEEPRIVAGWSDAAYDNIERILQYELEKEGLPALLSSPVLFIGRMMNGLDLIANTPSEAVKQLNNRPLYIVHSAEDETVPIASSLVLQESVISSQDVEPTVWHTEESLHIRLMFEQAEQYEIELIAFFRQHLNSQP